MRAAIDALYTAFAHVPKPSTVDGCPCCFFPAEAEALLVDVPLRELPNASLQPYAANVMLTVGTVEDFRYFLPRMLEIAYCETFTWPDLEPMVSRLRYAGWLSWPDAERDAVRAYLTAMWADTLVGDEWGAAEVLCAIGNAEDDLTPYLAMWAEALSSPPAAEQLREVLDRGRRLTGGEPRLVNAFWDDRPDQAAQVLAWLERHQDRVSG